MKSMKYSSILSVYIVAITDFIHLPLGKDPKLCNPLELDNNDLITDRYLDTQMFLS